MINKNVLIGILLATLPTLAASQEPDRKYVAAGCADSSRVPADTFRIQVGRLWLNAVVMQIAKAYDPLRCEGCHSG